MAQEPDRSLEACARLIAEIPAAVALFDRDRRYVAVSPAWAEAFALARATLAGSHHDEVCRMGGAALEHVQRCALEGDNIDDCPAGPSRPLHQTGATFSARPHHGPDGSIAGTVVTLQTAAKPVA